LEPQIIVSIFSINNLKHRWDIIPPEDSNAVRRAIRYFYYSQQNIKKLKPDGKAGLCYKNKPFPPIRPIKRRNLHIIIGK
jgi:hypothetical protein